MRYGIVCQEGMLNRMHVRWRQKEPNAVQHHMAAQHMAGRWLSVAHRSVSDTLAGGDRTITHRCRQGPVRAWGWHGGGLTDSPTKKECERGSTHCLTYVVTIRTRGRVSGSSGRFAYAVTRVARS